MERKPQPKPVLLPILLAILVERRKDSKQPEKRTPVR